MELLGWSWWGDKNKDRNTEEEENLKSISPDQNDGSLVVSSSQAGMTDTIDGGMSGDAVGYSMSFDVDPTIVSESQLITKYREISQIPEVEKAIDIIINEMISTADNDLVDIDLDELEYSEGLKEKIRNEFDYIVNLLDFNSDAYDILRRWYIDGRMSYQAVINEEKYQQEGIGRLVYIDPRKLKKVRVVDRKKENRTGVELYSNERRYWLFSEDGFETGSNYMASDASIQGAKLSEESIVQATSGLLNPTNTIILSWLHKAIRPLNQLKSLEDASIIYRISRAPERRVFYIDVGNLPPAKAEQVLKRQMQQYKSKTVYDSQSGTIRSDPKQMTMIEDYWLPRRSDGKATEISTLQSGGNLGEMDEVNYFLNKVYNSLNVPITRMDPQAGFAIGRQTEITRDEVALMKFVERLRRRFSFLFVELLKRQLALKNILNNEEFERIRSFISIEFRSDNHFDELLQNDVWEGRLNMLDRMSPYRGVHFSDDWIKRNILQFSTEDIEQMKNEMKKEKKEGVYKEDDDEQNNNFGNFNK